MTPIFDKNGEYEVTFEYQSGGSRLDIAEVVLLQNGQEIAKDTHLGTTGDINTANTYQNIVLIFDLGTVGDGSENFTYYFDDIQLN